MDFDVNVLALTASGVVAVIIGMVWYSPKVFGILWMRLSGVSGEAITSPSMA